MESGRKGGPGEIRKLREALDASGIRIQELGSLIAHNPLGIVILDAQQRILSCNRRFEGIFLYKEAELVGRELDAVVAGKGREEEARGHTLRTLQGEAVHGEGLRVRKDGREVYVEFFGVPVIVEGRVAGAYGVYQDVTRNMEAARALKRSEILYRTLFESALDGIFTLKDGRLVDCNAAGLEMFACTRGDILGRGPADFSPPNQPDGTPSGLAASRRIQAALEQGPQRFEWRHMRKDGTSFEAEIALKRIDLEGEVLLQAIVRDITEAKRALRALAASEERYRRLYEESTRSQQLYQSLIQSSPDPIVIYALDGTPRYVSTAFTRVFGWRLEELVGRRIPFVPEEERERTLEVIRQVVEKGAVCQGFETRRLTKEGRTLDVSISASRFLDHQGNPAGTLVILRDVSPQKALEAQLLQAQKLEAVGTLAGGVAHDFNNLLQAILGYAQILSVGKGPGDPDLQKISQIQKAAERARDLTQRLLIFGRKVKGELRPVDLNHEIREVVAILDRTIPKMIQIRLELAPNLPPINADPVQLEQILMNLGVNARDAMPDGGTLLFRTRSAWIDETFCRTRPGAAAPGHYVLLEVADTGVGMAPEIVDRIFEPFFSTKEPGRGTGLGLSIVYGIVQGHGGTIECETAPGKGTLFRIHFPALVEEPAEALGPAGAPPQMAGGKETILVVGDDPSIREFREQALGHLGYRILMAQDGEEAVRLYGHGRGSVDLVVLDLDMPGMGGLKCLERILEMDPQARILVASGMMDGHMMREAMGRGAAGHLGKPYDMGELASKVRELLESR